MRNFADHFKINLKAAKKLNHLPKFLSDVSMPEFSLYIESEFPSIYSSLDVFREEGFSPNSKQR